MYTNSALSAGEIIPSRNLTTLFSHARTICFPLSDYMQIILERVPRLYVTYMLHVIN